MFYDKLNGRADGADLDVGETGVRIGILIVWTGTVGNGVQPGHFAVIVWIAPHGHGQDHSSLHSLRHAVGDASLTIRLAIGSAVTVRQAVETVECRLLDSAAVLDVEALNLLEGAVVRSVDGDESGDDSESLGAVHLISRTTAVKVLCSASVSVETTAVRIALAI